MQLAALRKHVFYVTVIILLFMGSIGSVFRSDFEAKIVSVICALALTLVGLISYFRARNELQ